MIRSEYSVSYTDFLESMKAYRKVAKGAAFIYYFDIFVVPLVGLALVSFPMIAYTRRDFDTWAAWSWIAIVGVLCMVATPVIYRLQLRQTYRQRVSLAEGAKVVLEFDESTVRFTIPNKTEVTYNWSTFTGFAETRKAATLLVGRAAFHTIPKSALTDEGWVELRRIVNMNSVGK